MAALAKTTQALIRKDAPNIRMSYQDLESITSAAPATNSEKDNTTFKKRKRKKSSSSFSTSASASVSKNKVTTVEAKQTITNEKNEKIEQHDVTLPPISLPFYQSEQPLLLPTIDYTVALEKLQENMEKAKYLADKPKVHEPEEKQQHNEVQQRNPMRFMAPLTSNKVFRENYRCKWFNPLTMPAVDPFVNENKFGNDNDNDNNNDNTISSSINPPPPLPLPRRTKIRRVHSLALSDYDGSTTNMNLIMGGSKVEFVNPFADESNVLARYNILQNSVK